MSRRHWLGMVVPAQHYYTAGLLNCSRSNGCSHFAYRDDGAAAYGGRRLADHAFT
jgi:hypothetical protein